MHLFGAHPTAYILVTDNSATESAAESDDADYTPPVAKKCRRSLSESVVTREIPEYYGGRRTGPGKLRHVQNLGIRSSYCDKAKELLLRNLVWLEVRKLETHPSLLVPGWMGFNIKVRDHVVVVKSTVSYLDTIDSAATDLKTAYCSILATTFNIPVIRLTYTLIHYNIIMSITRVRYLISVNHCPHIP